MQEESAANRDWTTSRSHQDISADVATSASCHFMWRCSRITNNETSNLRWYELSTTVKKLQIKPNKTSTIIDFVSFFSIMTSKGGTHHNILHGFTQVGYIDTERLRCLYIRQIISTHCKDMTEVEMKLCISYFLYLIKIFSEWIYCRPNL